MSIWDRLGRSLFVACGVGLGWGIRGDFGHLVGAMYPGAILGLAWVFVSGSPALFSRMPAIAGLTAAGIGAGGMMSYGILHGYAQADTLPNYAYGFFTLFCQGGCWGIFGGAMAGLLAERKPVRGAEWLGFLASIFLGGWLLTALLVDLIGFQVNPPRNNISVSFLGGAIGLMAWLIRQKRLIGLAGATFGFLGFGLGMAGGRLLANAFRMIEAHGWSINHWNVMEVTCGFVGGGLFTFGMLGLGRLEPENDPETERAWRWPSTVGALYVLGIIPLWHLTNRIPDRIAGWTKNLTTFGVANPEATTQLVLWLVIAVCTFAALASILWAITIYRGRSWPLWLPTILLSFTMLLFQNLTALYFWYPSKPNYLNMHHFFWVLFGIMVTYVVFKRQHLENLQLVPIRGRWFIVVWTLGLLGLAGIIGLASLTNGPVTMKTANTRWPIWTWSSGPFPGR